MGGLVVDGVEAADHGVVGVGHFVGDVDGWVRVLLSKSG